MKWLIETILWVWQLPQNLLGFGMSLAFHHYGTVVMKDSSLRRFYWWPLLSAISLGNYRFVNKYSQISVAYHEYGHTKQSKMLGPLYLFVIGIPSIVWCIIHTYVPYIYSRWSYYAFYTESWANKLGGIK